MKDLQKKRAIDFTADLKEALEESVMCFIAESDKNDVFNILANAKEVGANMTGHTFVIDRSKLPVKRERHIKRQSRVSLRGEVPQT